MKYFEASALTGENVDKMFSSIIEDIIEMQKTRKKKILEEDLEAPMTFDNLKSARNKVDAETEPSEAADKDKVNI